MTMRVKLTAIGNSKGVRLPKSVLQDCPAEAGFDLEGRDGSIVLHPVSELRAGWERRFREMARTGDDVMLDAATPTAFDDEEWQW